MSKEYLENILTEIAAVTNVLVETAKIKECLENCTDDKDLKSILKRTRVQVDILSEKSSRVHKLFYEQYDDVVSRLNSIDNNDTSQLDAPNDTNQEDITADTAQTNGEHPDKEDDDSTPVVAAKPSIKLVDINKLVEPKSIIKKEDSQIREKKTVQFDDTIIITSSDDEQSPVRSRKNRSFENNRSDVNSTRKKLPLHRDSISKVFNSKLSNRKVKTGSSSSDSSDSDSDFEPIIAHRKKKPSKEAETATKDDSDKEEKDDSDKEEKDDSDKEEILNPELDKKFKMLCKVNLLRIPCEKLKEYYDEQKEMRDIERLSNLSTLNAKRVHKDNDTGTNSKKQREKPLQKSGDEESDGSVSDHSTSSSQKDEQSIENVHNDSTTSEKEQEECAEMALAMLSSDKEDDSEKEQEQPEKTTMNGDDAEEIDKCEEKSTAVDDDTETSDQQVEEKDKETVNNTKSDTEKDEKEKEKEEKETDQEEKKEKEKEENEEDKEEEKEDEKEEKEKEKEDKKEEKEKEKTKKKIISSESEDSEMDTFLKKTDKIKSDMQSDVDKPTGKKKRLLKRKMKKALISDSDSDKSDSDKDEKKSNESESDSSESEKENEVKKPTRKRVKRVAESSDEDGDEKSTRKQIRKVWSKDSLAETTKKAEAEERERKARIAEKQKKYNQIYEGDFQLNATVEKVVLDFDEKTKSPLLEVNKKIATKLKPHQGSGIQFMWDACFESLERAQTTKGSGCILAHCMGLGKTLQVIALAHTLITNSDKTKVRTVMVVSPINTILNWKNEFRKWQRDLNNADRVDVYELISSKQNNQRQNVLLDWQQNGGVLIIGYNMFRNLSNVENKRISKKMRTVFKETLVDPGPDLVVCDEGHLLKNEKTNISVAMNKLKTLRRIVLTGTPLQNNLKEYFCMVQFIKPNLLGTYKEYLNRFVNPIINGQYTDSTPHDIQIMRKRSHVLHKMLDGVVQRRDYSVLQPYLPPKYEYVLFLKLTETQIKLYQHYMDQYSKQALEGRTSFIFVDFQSLQRICTHPRVLLDKSIEQKLKEKDESEDDSIGSLKDFINDSDDESSAKTTSSSSSEEEEAKPSKRKRVTRAAVAAGEDVIDLDDTIETEKEWWQQYCDGDELNNIELSSKIFLLFEILKECEQIGDKILVFSQSLYSLNVIEYFLGRVHDATEAGDLSSVSGFSGSWLLGLDYFRLDGSSSCDNRTLWCDLFNNPSNSRARLFLISTKAGGLGINLVAANRVIIFDVSWNPSHDIQSIYRVYRFGQTKPSYIYRFVTYGTMEMKIYERQVTKQAISKRVIDEQQIDRHYNQNDLQELYKFDPNPGTRPIPLVPKDVLLGELIQKFEDRIYKYHEHQSLLENKEEEGLNEEERKAAWEEFENEKKQRPTYGLPALDHNLSTALINIIMREHPTFTTMEVKNVLPALFMQLQQQVAKGDLLLYSKVQHEMRMLNAIQNQRMKEQFYQQQTLKMLQEQQKFAMANPNARFNNPALFEQMMRQMPGTSGQQARPSNPNEIIELND